MIHVDGGDGGGQLLRNALAYSAVTRTAVELVAIRAKRLPPGLRPQHLTGAMLAATLARGTINGATVGSQTLVFTPAEPDPPSASDSLISELDTITADTQTAGSVTLLVQCALPVLLCATSRKTRVVLKGGTNATMAPQFDYLQLIFKPFILKMFGIDFELDLLMRGFYPRGGGIVHLTVTPLSTVIPAIVLLDPGNPVHVEGRVIIGGNTPYPVAKRMKAAAEAQLLIAFPGCPISIEIDSSASKNGSNPCVGSGSGVIVYATTDTGCVIAGSSVGHHKVAPEESVTLAVKELARNVGEGGCVDEYLQDQIIIFCALAKGVSRVLVGPITDHTQSAMNLAMQMTRAKFTIEKQTETANIIVCEGIGE
ncbi:RNA 3'-terminal phosphate cyclase-like protein, partial [Obelidium mucronatum]